MANKEEIIIDVQIIGSDQIQKLSAMRAEMQRLKEENKSLEKQKGESKESDKILNELITQNTLDYKELSGEVRNYERTLLNEVKAQKENEGSLVQMRAQLSNLTKEYDNLSQSERQSAKGTELLSKIQGLTENLSLAEAESGRFQRMVGNYPDTFNLAGTTIGKFEKMLSGLVGTSGSAVGAFENMGKSVVSFGKKLLTTPIGWIAAAIAALVAIVKELSDAFKKNDEAMTLLQESAAIFRPILDAINKSFELLANVVGRVVLSIAEFTGKILNFFGIVNKEAQDSARDLVVAIDDLEEVERQYVVNSAKRDAEISELRANARDTEKYNAKEREEMLTRATELEKQNLEDYKVIAAEKLRIMEEEARRNADTSDETADKIAQARAELFKAEKSYNDGMRRLNRELLSARKEQAEEEKKLHQEALRRIEERKSKELAAVRFMEDLITQQINDEATRQIAEEQIRAGRQIEDLKTRLATEKNLTKQAKEAIEESIYLIAENSQAKIDALKLAAKDKTIADEINKEQNKISLLLEIAEKGSENEYNLKIEQIELLRKKELFEAEKTGADVAAINEKYNNQINEAEKQRIVLLENERKQILLNSYEESKQNFRGQLEELAQMELESEQAKQDYLLNLDEQTKAALFASDAEYTAAVLESKNQIFNAEQKVIDIQQKSLENQVAALQTFGDTISNVLGEIAGDSKEFLVFQKLIALGNASLNLATAISSATTQSTLGDPYTMAARIIANVGAVVVSFKQVTKAIEETNIPDEPKFAGGGIPIVGGKSYTGDKVNVLANSGEMILNLQQQKHLFDTIAGGNAGLDVSILKQAFSESLKEMPSPILNYREFTNFVNNTIKFDEYANI